MAKITIKDLKDLKDIDQKEIKRILGGRWTINPDLALTIFPKFEAFQIRFQTASPGEGGASTIKINL